MAPDYVLDADDLSSLADDAISLISGKRVPGFFGTWEKIIPLTDAGHGFTVFFQYFEKLLIDQNFGLFPCLCFSDGNVGMELMLLC